jgi:hypothetical protein
MNKITKGIAWSPERVQLSDDHLNIVLLPHHLYYIEQVTSINEIQLI